MSQLVTRSALLVATTLALAAFAACSDSDDTAGGGGVQPGNDAGAPGTGGGDAGAGTGACNDGRWLVAGSTTTVDVDQGFLHTMTDLTATGRLDLTQVKSFPGDINYVAFPDGVALVGQDGKSTLEKWQLTGSTWGMTGQVDLLTRGVTSTMDTIERVNDTKAYYFDTSNNQVIGFNPQTMLLDGTVIDLKPGLGAPGDFMQLTRIQREGDIFVVGARYFTDVFGTKNESKAAFIDSRDNSVTFAEDRRCGGLFYTAKDAAGNLYLGSHVSNTVDRIAGTGTSNSSCILRFKKGEKRFDPDYYVDMNAVLGGIGATLIDGPGDTAFIEKYEGPTTANFGEARLGEFWDIYQVSLADGAKTVTKVPLPKRTIAYGNGFVTSCGGREAGFLIMSGTDFATGQLFQIGEAGAVTPALSYSGTFLGATRLD